jgi:hypothetical protein
MFMTAAIDGQVILWDVRAREATSRGVGRLYMSAGTPPWCLSVRGLDYSIHLEFLFSDDSSLFLCLN